LICTVGAVGNVVHGAATVQTVCALHPITDASKIESTATKFLMRILSAFAKATARQVKNIVHKEL
jgi:hypothetical protein